MRIGILETPTREACARRMQWFILLFTHDERRNSQSCRHLTMPRSTRRLPRLSDRRATAAAALDGEAAVEAFRLEWLGRKQGRLNDVSGRWLKAAPPEAKKALGVRFNALKAVVEGLLDAALGAGPTDAALKAEAIDITLPGTRRLTGRRASHYAHAERDCRRVCGAGLLGGRGAGGRNRLLQLREHELSAGPSGARHAGHAGGGEPGAQAAARPAAAAHAHFAGADADHGACSLRRCAS